MRTGKGMRMDPREYLAAVHDLPCCICEAYGLIQTSPTAAHHSKTKPDGTHYGLSQKASHYECIPLCQHHHQSGPYGDAYHAGPRAWMDVFGDELSWVARTQEKLGLTLDEDAVD